MKYVKVAERKAAQRWRKDELSGRKCQTCKHIRAMNDAKPTALLYKRCGIGDFAVRWHNTCNRWEQR